jgi:hypothetical protein
MLSLGATIMYGSKDGQQAQDDPAPLTAPPLSSQQYPDKLPTVVGWHVIQTEDFQVRVKSDLDVVGDLELYLETLKKKIERLKAPKEGDGE